MAIGEAMAAILANLRPNASATSSEPPEPTCPTCKDMGWVRIKSDPALPGVAEPCPDCKTVLGERCARYDDRLGFIGDLRRVLFADLPAIKQQSEARLALETFGAKPAGWVILHGSYGCGKSTLAACTINAVRRSGTFALFAVASNLFSCFRATFNDPERGGFHDTFEMVKTCPVLAIDDLATVRRTDWVSDVLFELLNERYNAKLPTILTMNAGPEHMTGFGVPLPFAETDERLQSRFRDRALVTVIDCGNRDLRPLARE